MRRAEQGIFAEEITWSEMLNNRFVAMCKSYLPAAQ
jgi:hypothetical protein